MPRWNQHPWSCKACSARAEDGARISWQGYCVPCGEARELQNLAGLRSQSGPYYEHWLRRLHLATVRKLRESQSPTV